MSVLSKLVLVMTMVSASHAFAQWDRGHDNRPGRACFFENANYNGRSICLEPGQNAANLAGSFNDIISSISIDGNIRVRVFVDANYRGASLDFTRDVANLADIRGWNDVISSIQVFEDHGEEGGGHGPAPHPGPGPGHGGHGNPMPGPHR